ncbi:MAG: ATP-binding protein, partial [Bacteroidota bacterium]
SVYTRSASFYLKGDDTHAGTQIDLLIDRNDQSINVVEVKFYDGVFSITKDYAQKLQTKVQTFREVSQTNKQIFLTLIIARGMKPNIHSIGLVDQDFDAGILFLE